MSGSEFRAHWQAAFNEMAETRIPVLITMRGKPFLQLDFAGYYDASQDFPLASDLIPNIGVSRPEGRRS
jgi:PHD/YefM family antitoxin component YafN of YafNO toxin-antitoxin module